MQITNLNNFLIEKAIRDKISWFLFFSVITYICFYKLWLNAVVPFTVTMSYSADQTWFFLNARSITQGKWLGEVYNHYTLIKGPVYSIFLSMVANLGISPKLAIDVIYIAASLTFLKALCCALNNKIAISIGFLLVIMNPITASEYWAEPLRSNLYLSLVLIYLSTLMVLIIKSYQSPEKLQIKWALLCGFSLALAWNTREESIWMLSGLFPLLLILIWRFSHRNHRLSPFISLMIILLIPIFLWQYIAGINEEKYGFKGVSEFKGTQFARAANAIYSLNTDNGKPYIYLSTTVVDKLNTIGPSTQRLAKALLNDDGVTFKKKFAPKGSHSSWAIRSAMAKDGYYKDFHNTELAYQKIADEIEAYCQTNSGACRKTYIPGILIKQDAVKNLSANIHKGLKKATNFVHFPPSLAVEKRKRGDRQFQYLVNRFFNIHTDFDENYELSSEISKIELYRKNKLRNFYKQYKNEFLNVLLLSILICLITTIFLNSWQSKMIGILMIGSFSASFAIYILLTTFVLGDLPRALISSSIPMLCFSAYYLGLGIQITTDCLGKVIIMQFKKIQEAS